MLTYKQLNTTADFDESLTRDQVVDFLYDNLGQWGDNKEEINKSLDYAFSTKKEMGGFVLCAFNEEKELIGAVVINTTAMDGYIPSNILVYITVRSDQRGKRLGEKIMKEIFERTDGNIALHVEYENPAKRFYERIGFTTKYAEMRYVKQ
jgi:[ribosomal protein S18]-alanine N-acetyltransferase